MKNLLPAGLTKTLVALTVLLAGVSLTEPVMAKPATAITATKQLRRDARRIYQNYYRDNYERAIDRGILRRPSRLDDIDRALDLGYQALEQRRRDEAARRFAQALVMIENSDGTNAAVNFEQGLNNALRQEWNLTLSNLRLFERIFPTRTTANASYRDNYETAIDIGIIRRPSRTNNLDRVVELADRAMEEGRRDEAARRYAQALAMIEENYGTREAKEFEQELNTDIEEAMGQPLREYLPLFGRIFPRYQARY